jgi:hypothetical protein
MERVYSLNSENAAERYNDSSDLVKFASNQARKYHEARMAAIEEPLFPFEGIIDIPGLILTPAVFTYYLITGPFLHIKK